MNQALILAVQQQSLYLLGLRTDRGTFFNRSDSGEIWAKVRDSSYRLARTLSPLIEQEWAEQSITVTCAKAALDSLEAEILALDKKFGVTVARLYD